MDLQREARRQQQPSIRVFSVGSLEAEAPLEAGREWGWRRSRAKASWLSGSKVNIAPDVCPGVEAISSSLPAHFIFQN